MEDTHGGSREGTELCPVKVHTVEGYLAAVDKAYRVLFHEYDILSEPPEYSPKLWFRGVKAAATYNLEATITRKRRILGREVQLNTDYETLYLSRFKSKAIPYLERVPAFPLAETQTISYWGWLFLMRHYGVPTRIMDWSKNALVGLLFAIAGSLTTLEQGEDSAVWALNPVKLNEDFPLSDIYKAGYIPNVEEPRVYELFGPAAANDNIKPAAVIGPMNSPNIIAQNGAFTVFPHNRNIKPLNLLPDSSQYLYKIIIAKEARASMVEQLRRYGINEASLYPGISKIIDELDQEGF